MFPRLTMRTSRTAKGTSKYFDISSQPSSSSTAPSSSSRRVTRSSSNALAARSASQSAVPDIEDAVAPDVPTTAGTRVFVTAVGQQKRKRTTTITSTTGTSPAARKVKLEPAAAAVDSPSSPTPQDAPPPPPSNKPRRKPARKVITGSNTSEILPPTNWEEMYALTKEMRLSGPAANAAVDTMGCERLALPTASPRDRRFHTLIALMLSSQTKDTVNAVAMARLQTELPPAHPDAPAGLNLENILAVDEAELNRLIWQVGFHNNKARYIKQAAVILRDKYEGDIPPTIEGLMSLPGVGPKMAYLCMAAEHGWNRVEGIGVDVHVHRITNLWGWNRTKTPEETRLALQGWLPKDKWKEINWLLVGFGQSVCVPLRPRCGECELGLRGLCPAAVRGKVLEGRRRRGREMEGLGGVKVEGVEVGVDEDEDVKVEVKGEGVVKEEVEDEEEEEDVKDEDDVKEDDGVKEEEAAEEEETGEDVKREVKQEEVKEEDNDVMDEDAVEEEVTREVVKREVKQEDVKDGMVTKEEIKNEDGDAVMKEEEEVKDEPKIKIEANTAVKKETVDEPIPRSRRRSRR
ncbi:DNA N-glycosylase and apurinic/apyrimidinic lyase [Echria macrotheca]|uniref:Endonuclease III homolog n=1 Tax=Echria macrotheca TaxID=438768 RepID=A0AAJ0BAY5_9PEZI|nr:DNA N-glycosylase and apurinic/apyrimidinic lyase [Echria macrotheca]